MAMMKLLRTTTTAVIGKHEALFWDDGHLELQDPMVDFQQPGEEHVHERVCLDDLEQYRLLQLLLVKFAPQGGQQP